MEEKEIQTCVDGAVKTYFDKFAERVTQASENHLKNYQKTIPKFKFCDFQFFGIENFVVPYKVY